MPRRTGYFLLCSGRSRQSGITSTALALGCDLKTGNFSILEMGQYHNLGRSRLAANEIAIDWARKNGKPGKFCPGFSLIALVCALLRPGSGVARNSYFPSESCHRVLPILTAPLHD